LGEMIEGNLVYPSLGENPVVFKIEGKTYRSN
jgi:hypothetical protein